jgi:hypothetical protein
MKLSLFMILFAASLHAATIKLTWNPSTSSTSQDPGTVNVYRVTRTCPSSTTSVTWLKLATGLSADGPYIDHAANTLYPHCYYVTAVINGIESAPSNMIFVPVAPANLQGAWQP